MQKLTRTQVLALFLGTASASTLTPATLLNGPSSADRIPALVDRPEDDQYDQQPTPAMSATACAGNAGCAEAGESCGYFQLQAEAEGSTDLCVATAYCNSIGRLNGVSWALSCWADVEEGVTATRPAAVDADTYMTEIEAFITKRTVSWDGIQNIWVSSKFNFQDGWWVEKDDGKFWETDKPADNRCFMADQCNVDTECCGMWPDQNNRRCMARTLDAVAQTAGSVSFTPTCMVEETEEEVVVPENAQEDIAKGGLSEAAEALSTYSDNLLADAKTKAGYEEMTIDEKASFDENWTAAQNKRKEAIDGFKTSMGYDGEGCDDACKAVFEEDLLEWKKKVRETCEKNQKGIECRESDKIMGDLIKARIGSGDGDKNFYTSMTAEERNAFKENWKNAGDSRNAAIAAAWRADNAKEAGTEGGKCRAADNADGLDACNQGMCCGYSVPRAKPDPNVVEITPDQLTDLTSALGGEEAGEAMGQAMAGLEAAGNVLNMVSSIGGLFGGGERQKEEGELSDICVTSSDNKSGTYTDDLDQYYEHTCLATKLMGTAAASLAVVYSLM